MCMQFQVKTFQNTNGLQICLTLNDTGLHLEMTPFWWMSCCHGQALSSLLLMGSCCLLTVEEHFSTTNQADSDNLVKLSAGATKLP